LESYNNLINHWQKYKPLSGLHPDDKINPDNCVEFNNISEFINSKEYFTDSSKYHINLMPVPYIGNLLHAKIYFLLLNPGFNPQDYHDEQNENFNSAQIQTLKQEKLDCPYYPLDPRFCWTSTAAWSHKKLGLLIRTYATHNDLSYLESSKILSKQICSIELFPYHSKSFKGDKNSLNIKSTQLIREFVEERSQDERSLIFVMRQAKTWNLPERKNIIKFTPGEARGAHISKKYVDIILEYLKNDLNIF